MSTNENFVKYPDTLSLSNLYERYRKSPDFPSRPSVTFRGTVKLHGTNASVVLRRTHPGIAATSLDSFTSQVQSRNRIITYFSDNLGFAAWVTPHLHALAKLCFGDGTDGRRPGLVPDAREVMIAGEWAGKGIQSTVGISKLPRFWSVFAIQADGLWLRDDLVAKMRIPEARIFNVYDFQTWTATIDFALGCDPIEGEETAAIAREVDAITLDVERQCPAALALGGIEDGVGEGIVWTETAHADAPGSAELLRFKTKGPKHKIVNKRPNRKNTVKDENKEQRVHEFVKYAVTKARLDQGLDYLREMNLPVNSKSTKTYIRWVNGDVLKEEGLVLEEMRLNEGDVWREIEKKAKGHLPGI